VSRSVAVISVLALFLAGLSIGVLAMHLYHEGQLVGSGRPFGGPPHRRFLNALERELDLTPDQQQRIREIHEESHLEIQKLRHELRPRLERQMDETHDRILAVLTPEQQERFKELEREHRRRMGRFFLGEGRFGGRGRRRGPPRDAPPEPPPEPL
jgi:Spy/CpxP family protein refolding chaperone